MGEPAGPGDSTEPLAVGLDKQPWDPQNNTQAKNRLRVDLIVS